MHCVLKQVDLGNIFIIFIYASDSQEKTRQLWKDLTSIGTQKQWQAVSSSGFQCDAKTWRSIAESLYGIWPGMNDFVKCVGDLNLMDHPAMEQFYEWMNKRTVDFQNRKLDQILINEKWIEQAGFYMAEFLEPDLSNHSPMIPLLKAMQNSGPKPFRFFNHRCRNESFIPMIRRIWQTNSSNDPMENLYLDYLMWRRSSEPQASRNWGRVMTSNHYTNK